MAAFFCERCPLRGKATGELVDLYRVTTPPVVDTHDGKYVEVSSDEIGVMVDRRGRISEPLYVAPGDPDSFNRGRDRVEGCPNHNLGDLPWLVRKLKQRRCAALGEFAVRDRDTKDIVKNRARRKMAR